ncbi:MAG: N-acetylmuramoyl-L-alanine amidase [Hyphomicrobiales bacterium]|nr:N-acetylmuramoyl-L-alanine amidase [Hyphomicrobiales bacterium]MBV9432506.1 N-acetylmuramoyl-L-alanine amidase [Hyphomicrobiales bacterium]
MNGANLGLSRTFLRRNAGKVAIRAVRGIILASVLAIVSAFCPLSAFADDLGGTHARPVVVGAKLEQSASGTRLILISSQPLTATPFALEKPDRLVLDLPEVNFQLAPHTGESGTGLIKSFRFGLFGFGRSRIVIDLAGPAHVASVVNAPLLKDLGATVTIELEKLDRDAFHELAGASRASANSSAAATAATSSAHPTPPTKDPRPLVVIDPGHGGFDPGAMGASGEVEKTITLEFATTLATELERRGHVRVALTRSSDTFVSLPDRVRFARDQNAALFVSIHADTLTNAAGVQGATVYTLADHASDAEAARVAEKENRVDQQAGVDSGESDEEVVSILDDLMRRETKILSAAFAQRLVQGLESHVRLNKNPLRSAAFLVLRAPDVPSALVELGYLSSDVDRASFASPQWREEAARAIAGAIEARLPDRPSAAAQAN